MNLISAFIQIDKFIISSFQCGQIIPGFMALYVWRSHRKSLVLLTVSNKPQVPYKLFTQLSQHTAPSRGGRKTSTTQLLRTDTLEATEKPTCGLCYHCTYTHNASTISKCNTETVEPCGGTLLKQGKILYCEAPSFDCIYVSSCIIKILP